MYLPFRGGESEIAMSRWGKIHSYLNITWTGFRQWIVAQAQDAVVVGVLWLIGLLIIDVPLAPVWAFLGALFQLVPNIGTILALIGPAFSAALGGGWMQMVYVLILYGIIVIVDGFVLQPLLLKRAAKVPVWASIVMPIFLGLLFNIWGILLAPPLLAIFYTFREKNKKKELHSSKKTPQ